MMPTMQKEYRSLRRQPFLAPVWIFALAAVLALAAAAWAVYAASTTLVVVTRHAERAVGEGDDPPLSPEGVARAERLAAVLGVPDRARAIDAIFVSDKLRSAQTARALATRLAAPVVILPAGDVRGLERRILDEYRGKRVLVIAHSNTVPEIVKRLADGGDIPPIAENEYGTAYVVAVPRWSRPAVLRIQLP
jgi:broad specificity phosphatase PhoE